MNFKEFIFTEEINPNDTVTVYHRTKSLSTVSDILKSGFQPGGGDYYGKGLYTTISLESQFNQNMLKYGSIIVKFHVTNLDKYLVFQPNIAKRIHGQNSYKLSDQLKKFGLDHKFQPDYLSQLDQQQELTGLTDAENLKKFYDQNYWIQNDPSIKGVIYYGTNDGYCLLKYEPVNDGTITMLAYARADTSPETMKKLYNNEGWITSTDKAKIKQIEQLPSDRRSDYAQISEFKTPYELYRFLKKNDFDLNKLNKLGTKIKVIENILQKKSPLNDKIFDLLLNRSRSHDDNIRNLVQYASNKQEIAKLVIKNKKEFSSYNVNILLRYATDKQEIAKDLGSENISKLSDVDITDLIQTASDYEEDIEIAKIIIQSKKELKKELSDYSVYSFLYYASHKKEIAKILDSININKLSHGYVRNLIESAYDPQEMAQIINQYHTEKTPEIQEIIKKWQNLYNFI